MSDTHESLPLCTVPMPLLPILDRAVRANGIVPVLELLAMICDSKGDGDARDDWAAARDHLYAFVYRIPIGEELHVGVEAGGGEKPRIANLRQ